MKSNRIITAAGFLLFLSIVLISVWFLSPAKTPQPKELSLEQIVILIGSKQVKEVGFRRSQAEIVDMNGNKFAAIVDTDQTRESLFEAIKEYNKINSGAPIKYSEEPASGGWGWIVLINTVPFFIMWGLTLAVIVYAVRTLSRNKG
jgi:ATP-dependent Zn protease